MFIQLANEGQRWWLLGLLALWATLLFGGALFGRSNADGSRRMPTWTRMVSSFTLVVAAWSWHLFTLNTAVSTLSLLIAVGMTLGFIGDLCMAQLLPLRNYVLGGIGSFGVGHVAYITGLALLGQSSGLDDPTARWRALAVWLIIGTLGWYVVVFRGQKPSALHLAALPYALLLAGTAGLATGLALQNPVFVPLAAGAALFLVSDLILAAQLFNGLFFRWISDVVWLTYGPAQMLIVYAVGAALQAVGA